MKSQHPNSKKPQDSGRFKGQGLDLQLSRSCSATGWQFKAKTKKTNSLLSPPNAMFIETCRSTSSASRASAHSSGELLILWINMCPMHFMLIKDHDVKEDFHSSFVLPTCKGHFCPTNIPPPQMLLKQHLSNNFLKSRKTLLKGPRTGSKPAEEEAFICSAFQGWSLRKVTSSSWGKDKEWNCATQPVKAPKCPPSMTNWHHWTNFLGDLI